MLLKSFISELSPMWATKVFPVEPLTRCDHFLLLKLQLVVSVIKCNLGVGLVE